MKNLTSKYTQIRDLITQEQTDKALQELDSIIKEDPMQDEAHYLRGNIFRKQENWAEAMNSYTKAIEINPSSPAKQSWDFCTEILKFFNKDMFNH
jgi:Uncharacterized protein conserved in bacteria